MTYPGDFPGLPAYARIDLLPPHIHVVDGWAVVVFYRDPTCVRPDFNLLEFFDAPAGFGCQGVVEGFALFAPGVFPGAPKIAHGRGTGAVPIWFVPADAFAQAIADQMLTIGELAGLAGLMVGSATEYSETIQPFPDPVFGGGHRNPSLIQIAHGFLQDGRRFQYQLSVHDGVVKSSRLSLR